MTKDRAIIILFGSGLFFLVVALMVGTVGLPQTDVGPLVLKFDPSADQVEFLGGVGAFYGIAGVAAVTVLINLGLAFVVYNRERFLSYALATGTLLFSFLFMIAASVITAAN